MLGETRSALLFQVCFHFVFVIQLLLQLPPPQPQLPPLRRQLSPIRTQLPSCLTGSIHHHHRHHPADRDDHPRSKSRDKILHIHEERTPTAGSSPSSPSGNVRNRRTSAPHKHHHQLSGTSRLDNLTPVPLHPRQSPPEESVPAPWSSALVGRMITGTTISKGAKNKGSTPDMPHDIPTCPNSPPCACSSEESLPLLPTPSGPVESDSRPDIMLSVVDSPFGPLGLTVNDPTSYCPNFPVFADDSGDQDVYYLIDHGFEMLDGVQVCPRGGSSCLWDGSSCLWGGSSCLWGGSSCL